MRKPYKFRNNGSGVIRVEDGSVILPDPAGFHWKQYMDWVYAGNEADPADPPPPSPPRKIAQYVIVDRLTDEELELFRQAKVTLPARLVFLWDEAHNKEVNADDPRLIDAFTAIIGAERTSEVLS